MVDASVFVDLAVRSSGWQHIARSLLGRPLHAPAHVDVEVLSAVARLQRAGSLTADQARDAVDRFRAAPMTRHGLPGLVSGAWSRIDQLRVTDALYVELAAGLGLRLVTSDARLARATALADLLD